MDPADPNFLQGALTHQGAALGRHQTQLDAMAKTMETMAVSLTDLVAQIQQLQLPQPTYPTNELPTVPVTPSPSPQLPLHAAEPRLPPPERYSRSLALAVHSLSSVF